MALPSNVGFGKVTGAFLRATGDGSDADSDPDGVPLAGLTVKFSASVMRVKDTSADPPVTIIVDTVTCTTDDSGVLIDPMGNAGVWLVASTDPDLDPTGWTWTATISASTIPSFSTTFSLDVGQTLDLASLIPVPSNPGTQLAAWQAVVAQITGDVGGAQSLVDAASASASAAAVSATEAAEARDEAQEEVNAVPAAVTSALSTWFLRGNGSPVGVVTPSSAGVQYVDLAATNGALIWVSTGTTSNAWRVVNGDTGRRNITSLFAPALGTPSVVRVRRLNESVYFTFSNVNATPTTKAFFTLPTGFNPRDGQLSTPMFPPNPTDLVVAGGHLYITWDGANSYIIGTNKWCEGFITWATRENWPTTLPGTPA